MRTSASDHDKIYLPAESNFKTRQNMWTRVCRHLATGSAAQHYLRGRKHMKWAHHCHGFPPAALSCQVAPKWSQQSGGLTDLKEGKNQSPRLLAWVEFVGWGSREEGGRSVCEDTLRVFNPAAGLNMNRAGPCDLEPTPCCGDWEKNSYTKFYLQKQASVACCQLWLYLYQRVDFKVRNISHRWLGWFREITEKSPKLLWELIKFSDLNIQKSLVVILWATN